MKMNLAASSGSSGFGAPAENTEFRYVHSCDLKSSLVNVKIGTLEGTALPRLNYEHLLEDPLMKFCGRNQDKYPDLMIEVVVVDGTPPKFGNNQPDASKVSTELHLPITTSYKHFTKRWEWNEWIQLPIKYSDLPRNAQLCLTIFDCGGSKNENGKNRNVRTAIGGTTISMFGKRGLLRQGQIDLRVWSEVPADPGTPTKTPGKPSHIEITSNSENSNSNLEFYRLSKLAKKFRSGKIKEVDWLDGLSFAEIEKIIAKEKERSNLMFLMIEFPEFCLLQEPYSVVYYEKEDGTSNINGNEGISPLTSGGTHEYVLQNSVIPPQSDIILLPDSEIEQENLAEAKHHRLARQARAVDIELKPDTAAMRNRLNKISDYLPTQVLSTEEQDIVWRYRFYLASNKHALTKFVKCINWKNDNEAERALEHIVKKWVPIDVSDALELLGPMYHHPGLRQYAVNRLRQAPDPDLQLYLLQLVQALKYETHDQYLKSDLHGTADLKSKSSFDPQIDVNDLDEATEISDELSAFSIDSDQQNLQGKSFEPQNLATPLHAMDIPNPKLEESRGGLVQFLIDRACRSNVLANYFYWYLVIECEEYCANRKREAEQSASAQGTKQGANNLSKEEKMQIMYYNVLQKFKYALKHGPPEWKNRLIFLQRQTNFVHQLVEIIQIVKREAVPRQKKIEKLQALLKSTEHTSTEDSKETHKNRKKCS